MNPHPIFNWRYIAQTKVLIILIGVLTFLGACCVWGQDHANHMMSHHDSPTVITVDCSGLGSNQCSSPQAQQYIALIRTGTNPEQLTAPEDTSPTPAFLITQLWQSDKTISKAWKPTPIFGDISHTKNKPLIQQLPRSHLS